MTKELPTLFKKTATSAIQQWRCWTEGAMIYTEFGQQGGSLQTSAPKACHGKQGRSDVEQAEAEVEALWTKKLKNGYTKTAESADAGETDDAVGGGVFPMLAKVYKDYPWPESKFPAHAQPKLDGMRCIAQVDAQGKVTLWTRKRRPILSAPHVAAALEKAVDRQDIRGAFFDGELYADSHKDKFEDLMSLARKGYPAEGFEALEYHIYDYVDIEESFEGRTELIRQFFLKIPADEREPLRRVETVIVEDEDELMRYFDKCLERGYEGCMYRASLYSQYAIGKRSRYLLKVKPCDDGEFEILDIREGEGKMQGCGVFICKSPTKAVKPTFDVVMACPYEQRRKYFENPIQWIGKQLTVLHQGWTAYGQPRCPRGKAIRED